MDIEGGSASVPSQMGTIDCWCDYFQTSGKARVIEVKGGCDES